VSLRPTYVRIETEAEGQKSSLNLKGPFHLKFVLRYYIIKVTKRIYQGGDPKLKQHEKIAQSALYALEEELKTNKRRDVIEKLVTIAVEAGYEAECERRGGGDS